MGAPQPAPSRVARYAADAGQDYGLARVHVLGRCRKPVYVFARRALWRRLHDEGFCPTAIARATGFDHSTVIHGIKST